MASTARELTGSAQSRSLLPAHEYLPFVRRIARRVARRLPRHVGFDDLVGAGVVGLLEAMRRYDPERVTNFETFAEFRIRGAIIDELRRRDLMARDARIEAKQLEQTRSRLSQSLGREPEDHEMAHSLHLSVEALRLRQKRLQPVTLMSLDDVYPAPPQVVAPGPLEVVERRQKMERLQHAMGRLGPRQRQVLCLYYRDGMTLRQIGTHLGVTESRVCQIVSESTQRLRVLLGVGRKQTPRRRVGDARLRGQRRRAG